MVTEACPGNSCTDFGWIFLWKRSDAQVCRRSWKVIWGKPACFRSGTKDRWRVFPGACKEGFQVEG